MAFTKEELAKYNGEGGNPAYVAYRGKVYDISGIYGGPEYSFRAGTDLTDRLELGENIRAVLAKGIVVGGLSDG